MTVEDVGLRRQLLEILAVGLLLLDLLWAACARLNVDYGAFLPMLFLSAALFAGSVFYQKRRPDPRLSAMLFGAAFLVLFSACASVLNYCLLTVAGPRIDTSLAALDRSLGFDWPSVMAAVARHPALNALFNTVYPSMLPQVALLITVLAGRATYPAIYSFCLAVAIGALVCIAVWTLAPSFGAISVYELPATWGHLPLALDKNYARELVALLTQGPGLIMPDNTKGLIGFPSYHAVLALLVMYYAWGARWLRWPAIVLNLLVLAATPIQGGHHAVDVLGGALVSVIAIYGARACMSDRVKLWPRQMVRAKLAGTA
jgi:membrane-associated phospholipid phosphatase